MEFLFKPRSSGKRQVKPSQDIAFLEEQLAGDESSDDSEFRVSDDERVRGKNRGDPDDSDSSRTSSDDDEDEDEDDEGDEDDDEVSTEELLHLAKGSSNDVSQQQQQRTKELKKICGCCLGVSSSDANEVIECDACGVTVHEGCYGVADSTSDADSEVSAASTEPWFCEPCRAGLKTASEPPDCDLCPNLGGLYKETDVNRWVHLICALYIPGVAFGDPERLTRVTLFEMDYKSWGRRQCNLCEDQRKSKTGVCLQCDAGMCKSFFHALCGQKAGLLSEPQYNYNPAHLTSTADLYLAHCKMHTDKSVIKKRKATFHSYLLFNRRRAAVIEKEEEEKVKMEEEVKLEEETPRQRILRKLTKSRKSFHRERLRRPEVWVPTQKLSRMLTTSASAVKKLERVGEIKGLSVDRQHLQEQQTLSVIEARKKWHIAPSFSVEYVAYYYDRQNRLASLKTKLQDQLKIQTQLRDKETQVRPQFDLNTRRLEAAEETNQELRTKTKSFRSIINKMGPRPLADDCPALKPIFKPLEIITPNVKAKTTLWASTSNGGGGASSAAANNGRIHPKSPKGGQMSLKTCDVCSRTKDQHLMCKCDGCKKYYHLGCLTPPLTRMPKKSKLYGWECSQCDKGSGDSSDENLLLEDGPRKKRQAAARALAATSSRANSDVDEDGWEKLPPSVNNVNGVTAAAAAAVESVPSTSEAALRETLLKNEALKEEKRRKRRAEKEKRRMEKRRRKEEKRKRRMQEQEEEEEDEEETDEEENECEIIEDENGHEIVIIKPKPIKLKVKNNVVVNEDNNGKEKVNSNSQSSGRRSTDQRTKCDKCEGSGSNENLVRCDDCSKCFHFACLDPPAKRSPKVAGYSWACSQCAPSDVDSDWHLD